MRLAEWDSIVDPPLTDDFPVCGTSPHLVASLWSEDLLVPTSGDNDDGNDTTLADGEDESPSEPCCRR